MLICPYLPPRVERGGTKTIDAPPLFREGMDRLVYCKDLFFVFFFYYCFDESLSAFLALMCVMLVKLTLGEL